MAGFSPGLGWRQPLTKRVEWTGVLEATGCALLREARGAGEPASEGAVCVCSPSYVVTSILGSLGHLLKQPHLLVFGPETGRCCVSGV